VPKLVIAAIALYIVAVVAPIWGSLFSLAFGIPFLLYQGYLLYQIARRRNWARIALLIIVIFVVGRFLASALVASGLPSSSKIPPPAIFEFLAEFGLRVAAVTCLFLEPASRWFLSAPPSPRREKSSGQWPTPRASWPEARNLGSFGSTQSIRDGILVGGIPIAAFLMISNALHHSLPSDDSSASLKAGDSNYPTAVASPIHVIPLIVTRMELSNYRFSAGYTSDVTRCGHQIGAGGYFPYDLSVPIEMVGGQEGTYRGSFTIDKFHRPCYTCCSAHRHVVLSSYGRSIQVP
jgi:hypothetical protein